MRNLPRFYSGAEKCSGLVSQNVRKTSKNLTINLARILILKKRMRRNPKINRPWISASFWLLELGTKIGHWSEGSGLAPRLFSLYMREKSVHGA